MMPPPSAAYDASSLRSGMMLLALLAMVLCLPMRRRGASSAKRHHGRRTHHLPDRANIIENSKFYNLLFSVLSYRKRFFGFLGVELNPRNHMPFCENTVFYIV